MLYCLSEPFKNMAKHIVEAEVKNIEIVDDGFHTLNKKRVMALKETGASYDIKFSVHAPFADINIASPSHHMLKAMLKRLEKSIKLSRMLEAYMWVFHPGLKTGISMFYPQADWKQNCKTAHILYKMAKDYDVRIAVENVPEPYPFLMKSVDDFQKFYKEIDVDVGLVLDVGHSNLNGQTERFLNTFQDRIVHIHVHDNDGTGDQHLGIGYGTVNWAKFAKLLKENRYCGMVVVESVEHIKESVQKLKGLVS